MQTHFVGTVDSTNSEALRCLEAGKVQLPCLLVADSQRQGRGRGGKVWTSPTGNFYGTFALAADKPDATMAQVSFVAAVALAQVLEGLGLRPQLKWPNDILIDGGKVSGILLEKHGEVLLVGMGVNVAIHPNLATYASTSLGEQGVARKPRDLGTQLAAQFAQVYATWHMQGFAPISAAWLDRAYGMGQSMTARLAGGREVAGRFGGLGPDGALRLETPKGPQPIHAAEVYFHAARH